MLTGCLISWSSSSLWITYCLQKIQCQAKMPQYFAAFISDISGWKDFFSSFNTGLLITPTLVAQKSFKPVRLNKHE